jgi:hypothetical protein
MASPSERIGIRSLAVDELAVGGVGQPMMAEPKPRD